MSHACILQHQIALCLDEQGKHDEALVMHHEVLRARGKEPIDCEMLRFGLGSAVQCNRGGWEPGKVVAHFYREDPWPADEFVPYQVRLDGCGSLIYAPEDDDSCIRASTSEDA